MPKDERTKVFLAPSTYKWLALSLLRRLNGVTFLQCFRDNAVSDRHWTSSSTQMSRHSQSLADLAVMHLNAELIEAQMQKPLVGFMIRRAWYYDAVRVAVNIIMCSRQKMGCWHMMAIPTTESITMQVVSEPFPLPQLLIHSLLTWYFWTAGKGLYSHLQAPHSIYIFTEWTPLH